MKFELIQGPSFGPIAYANFQNRDILLEDHLIKSARIYLFLPIAMPNYPYHLYFDGQSKLVTELGATICHMERKPKLFRENMW